MDDFCRFSWSTCRYSCCTRVERMRSGQGIFIFGLVLCIGLSVVASYIEVAAIIGAFLAGMALAEAAEDNPRMHRQMSGVTEFLVPFFLVNIGMLRDNV